MPWDPYYQCRDVREMIVGVMVTSDSEALAKRAVESFFNQTYPSKALVIVNPNPAYSLYQLHPCITEITAIHRRGMLNSDAMRSAGMAEVPHGTVVVLWDDTVWRPPTALAVQHSYMVANNLEGCALQRQAYFFPEDNSSTVKDGRVWGIPRSIMTRNTGRLESQMQYPDMPWEDDEGYLNRVASLLVDQFELMPNSPRLYYELVWGEDAVQGAFALPATNGWCQSEDGVPLDCSADAVADHRVLSQAYPPNLSIF
jgi:hypothetical protein